MLYQLSYGTLLFTRFLSNAGAKVLLLIWNKKFKLKKITVFNLY